MKKSYVLSFNSGGLTHYMAYFAWEALSQTQTQVYSSEETWLTNVLLSKLENTNRKLEPYHTLPLLHNQQREHEKPSHLIGKTGFPAHNVEGLTLLWKQQVCQEEFITYCIGQSPSYCQWGNRERAEHSFTCTHINPTRTGTVSYILSRNTTCPMIIKCGTYMGNDKVQPGFTRGKAQLH